MRRRPSFLEHLHPPTVPAREARFRYTFGLGGTSLLLTLILIGTGILEMFYYVPTAENANPSVQTITHLVPLGWLVRGLHYWAGQALVVTVVLHLLRVVLTGAYKRPRRLNWLLGLSLLVAVLLLDFTGLVLRWDSEIAWALMVGTNLLKSIPGIGPSLYGLAVGSPEIGAATVVRFYGWHVFGLMLPGIIVIVWHIFRVRRDGGISHRVLARPTDSLAQAEKASDERIPRSELLRRETLATLLTTALLLALTVVSPPGLGPAADFRNLPSEATAPWFFIWIQQLLRLGDPFPMGVLIPVGMLTLLAILPYTLDRNSLGVGVWFNPQGRRVQILVLGMAAFILSLTLVGVLR